MQCSRLNALRRPRRQALARDDTPALLDALGALLAALQAGRAGPLPPGGAAAAIRAAWGLAAHLLDRGLPAARALLAAGARSTVVRGSCLAPARCVAAPVRTRAGCACPVPSARAALREACLCVLWRRAAPGRDSNGGTQWYALRSVLH